LHQRGNGLAGKELVIEIHRQALAPGLGLHREGIGPVITGGVIDQHINAAFLGGNVVDRLAQRGNVSHIDRMKMSTALLRQRCSPPSYRYPENVPALLLAKRRHQIRANPAGPAVITTTLFANSRNGYNDVRSSFCPIWRQ
jgi:hypothetical protein